MDNIGLGEGKITHTRVRICARRTGGIKVSAPVQLVLRPYANQPHPSSLTVLPLIIIDPIKWLWRQPQAEMKRLHECVYNIPTDLAINYPFFLLGQFRDDF